MASKQKVPTVSKPITLHKQMAGYKKGGAVHTDEAEDRATVKKMVKPAALTGKKCGGAVKRGK